MPRRSYSNTLEADIRNHFGLTQQELARYLGISRVLVTHIEAGRRLPTSVINKRLFWLGDLLPAPEGHGPVAPDFALPPLPIANAEALLAVLPDFGPLPPATLRKRQRQAGAQAAALRWTLHRESKQMREQQRRQWAVTVLQGAPPPTFATAADQFRFEHWLGSLVADVAAASPTPADAAARALAVVRVLMLEAEAEALERLLQLNGATLSTSNLHLIQSNG